MEENEKMEMETADVTQQNIDKIAELFPNCVTEIEDKGKSTPDHKIYKKGINFDRLRQILSNDIVEGREAYDFTWVGKKASILEANKPIRKTLRPCINESLNWDTTENLYIEGDNLEVLKLLRESYLNKVKMIYIDPPYNTGNDFIYEDDYTQTQEEYDKECGVCDENGNRLFKNTDSNGRFHSDWCSMIYPRLLLARDLLREDGVIFISIDDNEVANLKKICDEVFGKKNFVTTIHVELSTTQGMKVKAAKSGNIVKNAEYILLYSKNGHKNIAKTLLYDYRPEYDDHYSKFLSNDYSLLNLKEVFSKEYPKIKIKDLSESYNSNKEFRNFVKLNAHKIVADDKITGFNIADYPEIGKVYSVIKDENKYLLYNNGSKLRQLLILADSFGQCDDFKNSYGLRKIRGDWWKDFYRDMGNVSKEGDVAFVNGKKPLRLIKQITKMVTLSKDIILDFFSGSATTAHAVMQLNAEDGGNRKFIMVQLPESCDEKSEAFKAGYKNICEIGKERIRRAGAKIKEALPESAESLDVGFRVFKVDESNMKDVYFSAQEYDQNILPELESNIKTDRTDLDLLFGCLLESKVPLSMPYKSEKIDGYTVHTYGDGDQIPLIACFEENITDSVIDIIAKRQPLRVVLRDSCFRDSAAKINMRERFKTFSPNTKVKVI